MTPRVFIESPHPEAVTLDPRQSHHLVRVLRLRNGSTVEIFDGNGRVWQARVTEARARACRIEPGPLIIEQAAPGPSVHLAQALLKGDAMDRLLRQATELGVAQILPLASERTREPLARAAARRAHWWRIIIGACEQSRRSYLPVLHEAQRFADFIDSANPDGTLLLHPHGEPLPAVIAVRETTVLVGPEGGWSAAEVSAARTRGIPVHSLGPLVLRAETAPLAALAAIRHAWGWR